MIFKFLKKFLQEWGPYSAPVGKKKILFWKCLGKEANLLLQLEKYGKINTNVITLKIVT